MKSKALFINGSVIIALATVLANAGYAQTQPKPATEATKAANRALQQSLNFNDREDFDNATRGLIAKPEMRRALSEQHARLVAFNDRHQHSGQPDRPHRSHSATTAGSASCWSCRGITVGSANPVGTSNVSLSCAREKNSDAVRARSLCAAGINSRFSIHAFSLAR
jgi:hypothetical protein